MFAAAGLDGGVFWYIGDILMKFSRWSNFNGVGNFLVRF